MDEKRALTLFAALVLAALCRQAHAEPGISLAIDKHARLTEQGAIVISIQVVCGPFAGFEEFQDALAGAFQEKHGAEAEGGIDGTIVCDGVERTHTARLSSFTDTGFKHGPAGANASLFICTLVQDEQICFQGGTQRTVVIRGRKVS
jgi:hypothetical protein